MVTGSHWNYYFGSQESNADCKGWWPRMASILAYLFLPVAGLTMFWLKKEFFTKIMIRVDGLYLPVACQVFGTTRSIVDWSRTRLPKQWSSHTNTLSGGLADFWKDGSLLCTLINSAIPGACPNPYRHWNKPPSHAQDIAYKYLGIVPIFTESDFSCELSPYLETKLLNYLIRIRKSIHSLEKDKTIYPNVSPKFVARGMGLYTAEQLQQTEFFVYSKYDQVSFFNIEIIILVPYSTYCRTTVLEYLVKENRSLDKAGSTPESVNIHIELERERVKVAYIARNCGIHEIILSCNKESIMGSPFYVNVMKSSPRYEENNVNTSEVCAKICRENVEISDETNGDNVTNGYSGDSNTETISTAPQPDVKHDTPNKSHIADGQTMEISKYLKDLSNSQEKKVNTSKNIFDKIWGSCPDYFTRENYAYFQKLVDSSFRKACRITRAHPRFCQKAFAQFSNASPICSTHIDPEGGKLGVDEKRRIFSIRKSSAVDNCNSPRGSSFSINESREETSSDFKGDETFDEAPSNALTQTETTNGKSLKSLNNDTKKRRLQGFVKEKKLFWESMFNESKTDSHFLDKATNESRKSDNTGKRNLSKPLDSLNIQRKCPLSKSLSDLRRTEKIKKMKTYRSLDCNLDMCCEISLEKRAKLYLDRALSFNGNIMNHGTASGLYVSKRHGTTNDTIGTASKSVTETNEFEASKATSSNSFKRAISYFQNLDRVKLKSPPIRGAPPVMVEDNSVEINISFSKRLVSGDTPRDLIRTENSHDKKKFNTLPVKKERRSVINSFDVLY